MEIETVQQTSRVKTLVLGLIGVVVLASGCQTNHSINPDNPAVLDNSKFMSLWETYSDCKLSSDFNRASAGMQQLSSAAILSQQNEGYDGFVLPLPTQLERLVSNPANRLAVDLHAMTAACSLHTGQLALHEGHIDEARQAFASILTLNQNLSPYYVLQAKRFLTELERGIDIAAKTP
ncbi:MAG: hypothetical protein K2Q17_18030 [Nitrospiraceae bacterium]|jgi:hypothetical protein|uniref:hypothetical protein n=1 Tax=Nitrospira cf. moscoviensis SBR1015 TaxID=96242 RepID=UPI00111E97F8|nr:hypothetical protein [Nitrospira cf. moscoviensis SBR1015]MBY0249554.1 hypothetical protein [Nitrospiraceae bacterium]